MTGAITQPLAPVAGTDLAIKLMLTVYQVLKHLLNL